MEEISIIGSKQAMNRQCRNRRQNERLGAEVTMPKGDQQKKQSVGWRDSLTFLWRILGQGRPLIHNCF